MHAAVRRTQMQAQNTQRGHATSMRCLRCLETSASDGRGCAQLCENVTTQVSDGDLGRGCSAPCAHFSAALVQAELCRCAALLVCARGRRWRVHGGAPSLTGGLFGVCRPPIKRGRKLQNARARGLRRRLARARTRARSLAVYRSTGRKCSCLAGSAPRADAGAEAEF